MTQPDHQVKPSLILVGGGGHCKSCIDVIEQEGKFAIRGIVDTPERVGEKVLGYEIIGADNDLPGLAQEGSLFLITLGQIKSPQRRVELYERICELGGTFPIIASPFAYVSPHTTIGAGTIVMHHALINAAAIIGRNCIINSKALIEHDTFVRDHCHVATGAVINGGTVVGERSFVGSNVVCREYIQLSPGSVIPAGSRVMRSV